MITKRISYQIMYWWSNRWQSLFSNCSFMLLIPIIVFLCMWHWHESIGLYLPAYPWWPNRPESSSPRSFQVQKWTEIKNIKVVYKDIQYINATYRPWKLIYMLKKSKMGEGRWYTNLQVGIQIVYNQNVEEKDCDIQSIYIAERAEKSIKIGPKIGQIPMGQVRGPNLKFFLFSLFVSSYLVTCL